MHHHSSFHFILREEDEELSATPQSGEKYDESWTKPSLSDIDKVLSRCTHSQILPFENLYTSQRRLLSKARKVYYIWSLTFRAAAAADLNWVCWALCTLSQILPPANWWKKEQSLRLSLGHERRETSHHRAASSTIKLPDFTCCNAVTLSFHEFGVSVVHTHLDINPKRCPTTTGLFPDWAYYAICNFCIQTSIAVW